jgi:hypothetical protein
MSSRNEPTRPPPKAAPPRGRGIEEIVGLGRLAAVPSLLVIYMTGFVVPFLLPDFARGTWPWRSSAPYAGLLVAAFACPWTARVLFRFCTRVVPFHASGKRRIVPLLGCFAGALFALGSLVDWSDRHRTVPPGHAWLAHPEVYEMALGLAWLLALVALGYGYARGRPRGRVDVLYLRTFLGFSDRAMMALLFSLIGGRRTVAVLTAPRSSSGSWDPFVISFRGNPFFVPWARSPVFMGASDADWQASVKLLIGEASQVIVDVSDLTRGVQAEVAMIRDHGSAERVIWLRDGSQAEADERVRELVGATMPAERVVAYERSFSAALPNLVLGGGVALLVLLLMPLALLVRSKGIAPVHLDRPGFAIGRLMGWMLPAGLFILAVFVRRAVDQRAARRLRSLLRGPR